jgi:hypothetical protein
MKKILLILLLSVLLIMAGCGGAGDNTQEAGFNFIFKYGVTGRNTLDTFQGTFTKDMVTDPAITIDFTLTAEEMDSINQKMVEIDFFSYPDIFSVTVPEGETKTEVSPYATYYFKVEYDGKTKELLWNDKYVNSDAQADKLKELIYLIRDIIEMKPEYMVLPEPSSGYL